MSHERREIIGHWSIGSPGDFVSIGQHVTFERLRVEEEQIDFGDASKILELAPARSLNYD